MYKRQGVYHVHHIDVVAEKVGHNHAVVVLSLIHICIQKVAESMKDMDMVNGRTFIRNATLEHFGVPREIMGITESSNRATSEAAQYIYAQNVLMPRLRRREEAINQQLLPMFGEGLLWRYDDIVPRNQEFEMCIRDSHSLARLLSAKQSNPHVFMSLYQQDPRPAEGLLFPAEALNYFEMEDIRGRTSATAITPSGVLPRMSSISK